MNRTSLLVFATIIAVFSGCRNEAPAPSSSASQLPEPPTSVTEPAPTLVAPAVTAPASLPPSAEPASSPTNLSASPTQVEEAKTQPVPGTKGNTAETAVKIQPSVEPAKTVEPVKATEAAKTVEPVKTTEAAKTVEPVKATEAAKTVEPVRATEAAKTVEPVKATEAAKTVEPGPSEETAGLFDKKCANCHGKDGKGTTSMGKKLGVHDLTDHTHSGMSESNIRKTIAEGMRAKDTGKQLMPAYAGKLTDEQIDALARFVRRLGK